MAWDADRPKPAFWRKFKIMNFSFVPNTKPEQNVIIPKYLPPLQHRIQSSYDSTDLNLNWENLKLVYRRFEVFPIYTYRNAIATVICEKQTLRKIHPNPPYPHRRLSLAIPSITEETCGRCRYIIKFTKIEFNCLHQRLPFSSCNPLSPFSQKITNCRVGRTRLLGMALYQPLTLIWYMA